MLRDLYDMIRIIYAKARSRPVALCDVGDVDGIVSAALFLRKFPHGVVVLRAPTQVQRSRWLRHVAWTYVADLPCPPGSKVKLRADHHKTNPPCAERECYDPEAPCAAYLAAKLLELEGDPHVQKLISIAIETDTANIRSSEAKLLDLAVRYATYRQKLKLARELASRPLEEVLNLDFVRKAVGKGQEAERMIEDIVKSIPEDEILTIYFPKRLDISFRQLNIALQKSKRSRFVNILVRLGFRTYRLYCGADRDGPYDCTVIARELGGGGHKFAAGAQFKAPLLRPHEGFLKFVNILKIYLRVNKLTVYVVNERLSVKKLEF